MNCEICGNCSNLASIQYDKIKCVKPLCNEKRSHRHNVCIKCCDRIKWPIDKSKQKTNNNTKITSNLGLTKNNYNL